MARIWANRLIASLSGESQRTFAEVPEVWKEATKSCLRADVMSHRITLEQYNLIVGEDGALV